MPATHRLDASVVHYEWNNAIPPRLVADPGDTLVLDTSEEPEHYQATHGSLRNQGSVAARAQRGDRTGERPKPRKDAVADASRATARGPSTECRRPRSTGAGQGCVGLAIARCRGRIGIGARLESPERLAPWGDRRALEPAARSGGSEGPLP
jgi:hypothetical protein